MPLVILVFIMQVVLVVHVMKTGRDQKWIWIVMMLPGAGGLAYILLELAPDLLATRQGRNASKRVMSTLNPNKEFNTASLEYERSSTVANSVKLAEECLAKDRFSEAAKLYRGCLTGMNEFDPDIMFGLAQSEYGLGNHTKVRSLLDTVIEKNPDYKNQEAHLLYAMNLQQLGDVEKALEEYDVLAGYYSGPEPTYRYAMLLKEQGKIAKANQLFESIMRTVELSPKYYSSLHREWIQLTKKELS